MRSRDWSSDVCSSDLLEYRDEADEDQRRRGCQCDHAGGRRDGDTAAVPQELGVLPAAADHRIDAAAADERADDAAATHDQSQSKADLAELTAERSAQERGIPAAEAGLLRGRAAEPGAVASKEAWWRAVRPEDSRGRNDCVRAGSPQVRPELQKNTHH